MRFRVRSVLGRNGRVPCGRHRRNDAAGDLGAGLLAGTAALDERSAGAGGSVDDLRAAADRSREKLVGALYAEGWVTSMSTDYDHGVITLKRVESARDLRMESPPGVAASGRDGREVVLQDDLRFNEHLRMFSDAGDPNHRNAQRAARMPLDERLRSPQFAACELAAQEAARRTLAEAGVAFEPFDERLAARCRPEWQRMAADPGSMARVEQSVARGCDRMSELMLMPAETRDAPPTRGAGRPVGGSVPAAPSSGQVPARS